MTELELALEHHTAGRLEEAEKAYRSILESQPRHPDVLHLLGVIGAQRGQHDSAAELIEEAIRIDSTVASYHSNLGKTLRALGRLDGAIDAFSKALELEFDNDTLEMLSRVLVANDQAEQAVELHLRVLSLSPNDVLARKGLVYLLRTIRPVGSWPELEQMVESLFRFQDIAHQQLAGITANQLKHRYGLPRELPLREVENRSLIDSLSKDRLLIALLTQTLNLDFELERFLTDLRRFFLLTYHDSLEVPKLHAALIGSLAQQCFNNEYLFASLAEEVSALEDLKKSICESLDGQSGANGGALENSVLLLGCYESIASLPCATKLAKHDTASWSQTSQTVFQRTLLEPLEEREIEKTIDSLGEIDDQTSTAVRTQYEDHPFPRWLSAGQPDEYELAYRLSTLFPRFERPAFVTQNPRILVAGCGTGEEPITIALANPNSEVVAVDLSRRSIAYATRMARKLGVTNIRFLQADIMNLGELDGHFHFISSSGVLHHLGDPLAGWRVLVDKLVPAGLMQIALYSKHGRAPLSAMREEAERRGLEPVSEDIKSLRANRAALSQGVFRYVSILVPEALDARVVSR
jgi:SAM-dependent methyltransferase/tetratricopeptide (TPR) repeat protein